MEYSLIKRVDELQKSIEMDTTLPDNEKVKCLRGVEYLVKGYNDNYRKKDYPHTMAPMLVNAYIEAMALDRKGESIEPVVQQNTYGIGMILIECFRFRKIKGYCRRARSC